MTNLTNTEAAEGDALDPKREVVCPCHNLAQNKFIECPEATQGW